MVCDALRFFLEFTLRWDEWLSLEQQSEARAVMTNDYANAGWRAFQAGWVHQLRKQDDALLACASRAATHWDIAEAGPRERGAALYLRGVGHRAKGDLSAAIAAYHQALDSFRTMAVESQEIASTLNALAIAEKASEDLAAAEQHYREAIRVADGLGDVEGLATYTGNLAGLMLDKKEWQMAEEFTREALPLSEKMGRLELIAAHNLRLAQALIGQRKTGEALPHAQTAFSIYEQLGRADEITFARETLAQCDSENSRSDPPA